MPTFTYPLEQYYRRLEYLIAPQTVVVLGLGRTSPWNVEAVPPTPDPNSPTLEELFVYFKIPIRYGAKRLAYPTEETITLKDEAYLLYPEVPLEEIRLKQLREMYLEVTIDHNEINAGSFRSFGVFVVRKFLKEDHCAVRTLYKVEEVDAIPLYYENFPPVQVQEDLEQTFKLVIGIK